MDEPNGCNVTAFERGKFRYHCIPCQAADGSKDHDTPAQIRHSARRPPSLLLTQLTDTRAPLVIAQRLPALGPSHIPESVIERSEVLKYASTALRPRSTPFVFIKPFRPPFERTVIPATDPT
jgi:hypothetical protein